MASLSRKYVSKLPTVEQPLEGVEMTTMYFLSALCQDLVTTPVLPGHTKSGRAAATPAGPAFQSAPSQNCH